MNKSFLATSGHHLSLKDADIRLTGEILQLSRANEDAVWSMLRASPDGLDAAEAAARLASGGPNLIAKEGPPQHRRGVMGARQKSPERAAAFASGGFLFSGRLPRGDRHPHYGGPRNHHRFHPGASLQRRRRQTARHGEDDGERQTARRRYRRSGGPIPGFRRDPDRSARSRRYRAALGRRYDPGGSPADQRHGPLRQSVGADRRGHALGEVGVAARWRDRRSFRPAESLLHGRQRGQRIWRRRDRPHRRENLFRSTRRSDRRTARADQLRQGDQPLHLADDPLHHGDGAGRFPHQRLHQGGLARGAFIRGFGRGRPDAGNAADDRHRQSRQGRDGDVRKSG